MGQMACTRAAGPAGRVTPAAALIAAVACAGGTALAQDGATEKRMDLPSGLEAHLQEVLRHDGVWRFRFVAPGFTRDAGLETIAADLEHLCNAHALPNAPGAAGARIIVSLADRPSEFGVLDPETTQVFEAYRVENGTCIWEAF